MEVRLGLNRPEETVTEYESKLGLWEAIFEAYPRPEKVDRSCYHMEGHYCVGGAVCLFIGKPKIGSQYRFPSAHIIANILQTLNLKLTYSDAVDFGFDIIRLNEAGQFEDAKRCVREALLYGLEPPATKGENDATQAS